MDLRLLLHCGCYHEKRRTWLFVVQKCKPFAKCSYSNLVFGIQHLEQLATQLYSHVVIDRDVLQVVKATETPTFHKTAQLLASVEDYIKTNPSALGLFLSTLKRRTIFGALC